MLVVDKQWERLWKIACENGSALLTRCNVQKRASSFLPSLLFLPSSPAMSVVSVGMFSSSFVSQRVSTLEEHSCIVFALTLSSHTFFALWVDLFSWLCLGFILF